MRLRRRALLAAAVVAAGVLLAPQAPAATPTRHGLHVAGNRIADTAGRTVVLRGLNRAGTEGGPDTSSAPVTDAEIGWLGSDHPTSWRASAVRVLVGAAQWTGACPRLSGDPAAYRRQIDQQVRSITRRGMVALVDLHTSTAGCAAIGRHAMPDAPVAQQFWQSVAKHFSANRLVAFELYNEPHWVDEQVWRSGTPQATFQDCDPALPLLAMALCRATQPMYQAVGMQELVDLVSRTAPGHLVVVNGLDWGTMPPKVALRGKVVYGLHPYTCAGPGACQRATYAHANTGVLKRWLPIAKKHPVWVTEFGWPSKTPFRDIDGSAYYKETIAFLEAQKPAWGWLAFAMDGTASGAFTLTSSTTSYAPNPTGLPVFHGLRKFSRGPT